MNSAELVEYVAANAGLGDDQARDALLAIWTGIAIAARSGDAVVLQGFGQFAVENPPARRRHDSATGRIDETATARKLVFHAAREVGEMLNPAHATDRRPSDNRRAEDRCYKRLPDGGMTIREMLDHPGTENIDFDPPRFVGSWLSIPPWQDDAPDCTCRTSSLNGTH